MNVDLYRSKTRRGTGLMVPVGTDMDAFFQNQPNLKKEFEGVTKESCTLAPNTIGVDHEEAIKRINADGYYIAQCEIKTTEGK